MPEHANILKITSREEFRQWLSDNHGSAHECYVELKRGRPVDGSHFWYIDAVEEALCFGWIDSTVRMVGGKRMQRFSPRSGSGRWTELNKERVRRLERLGLMTDAGRAVLPDMGFAADPDVVADIVAANVWDRFMSFPSLYQRVRLYNLAFTRDRSRQEYDKALAHFIKQTVDGKMYGEWNDYGRLSGEEYGQSGGDLQ